MFRFSKDEGSRSTNGSQPSSTNKKLYENGVNHQENAKDIFNVNHGFQEVIYIFDLDLVLRMKLIII